jgi:hypothetical protein
MNYYEAAESGRGDGEQVRGYRAPTDDRESAIAQVAADSSLSNAQLQAALLDACGAPPLAIAEKLGKGSQYVYQLRYTNDEYKRVVGEFGRVVANRIVEEVADVDELFNRQIGPSAATLIAVRDSPFAKDADKIKASLAFLDRASKAPKATSNSEVRATVIQIPLAAMREMRKVLTETGEAGDQELLALIEPVEQAVQVGEMLDVRAEDQMIPVRRM